MSGKAPIAHRNLLAKGNDITSSTCHATRKAINPATHLARPPRLSFKSPQSDKIQTRKANKSKPANNANQSPGERGRGSSALLPVLLMSVIRIFFTSTTSNGVLVMVVFDHKFVTLVGFLSESSSPLFDDLIIILFLYSFVIFIFLRHQARVLQQSCDTIK